MCLHACHMPPGCARAAAGGRGARCAGRTCTMTIGPPAVYVRGASCGSSAPHHSSTAARNCGSLLRRPMLALAASSQAGSPPISHSAVCNGWRQQQRHACSSVVHARMHCPACMCTARARALPSRCARLRRCRAPAAATPAAPPAVRRAQTQAGRASPRTAGCRPCRASAGGSSKARLTEEAAVVSGR